uniref:neugrin-like n=1 Tax=Ciona intestinalis TaxID=7719 RepID=UPI00052166D1|nr:neugrin-like [Ciona intestinalis]|eukprot:XP_009857647.1 neugrin-like [Ciona intestinalis]
MQRSWYVVCKILFETSATPILKQIACIHTSGLLNKNRKTYYNNYIKDNKPKIYSGFIEDVLEKTQREWLQNTDNLNEPDYERVVLDEARRRRNIYRRKKTAKQFKIPEPIDHKRFSYEQKEQIRFLHREDPEYYNVYYLTQSFGANAATIRKILKSSYIPKRKEDRVVDKSVKEKLPSVNLTQAIREITEPSPRKTNSYSKEEENPKFSSSWFHTFKSASEADRYPVSLELIPEDLQQEIVSAEELDDHFLDLFVDEMEAVEAESLEDDEFDEDSEDTDDEPKELLAKTGDNVNFYDEEGNFLYKIY